MLLRPFVGSYLKRSMTSRLSWKQLPNVFSIVVILLLAALYVLPSGDLDYAILIRLGELIYQTGQIRPPESFSYTINGADVPDFEWLFEVTIWGIWSVFGYGGLKLLKVLLVGTTLVLVGLRLRSEGVRWHGIALSVGFAVMVLAPSWNLRPLFFTTIGLLLVSWWLHDHCTGKRPLSWWLPVVMLVWGNVHPGVITGQGLLAGAILWEWVNQWVKLNTPLDKPRLWRLTLIGGLGLAATFVSPAPLERLLCPFRPEVRHPIMRIYVEMQPLYQAVLQPPYRYMLVLLLAELVLLTVILRFRHYRLWEIGLLAGTAALAMMAIRSVQDWVVIMLSLGVPHLAILLRQWAKTDRRRPWVAALLRIDRTCKRMFLSPMLRFQWFWPVAAVLVLTAISLIPPLAKDMPLTARSQDPVAAVNWMAQQTGEQAGPWNVFAPPDYGTYLVWRLGDRVRCYVDTRGFCYPPELTENGQYIPQLGPDWRARLEKVLDGKTQYFLLETTGPRGKLWQMLQQHRVQPLYQDGQAVLLTAAEMRRGLARMEGVVSGEW